MSRPPPHWRDRLIYLATTRALGLVTAAHLALLRLSGGRLGWSAFNTPILLLTTTGRQTGQARTVPLSFFRADGAFVVVASNAGAAAYPAWYRNLLADPHALVQTGTRRQAVVARVATPAERLRLWPRVQQMGPVYDAYRARTTRPIPLVLLAPAD